MSKLHLTTENIADCLLSDLYSYSEDIDSLVAKSPFDVSLKLQLVIALDENVSSQIYYDAWFRGADGKALDNADNGVRFKGELLTN